MFSSHCNMAFLSAATLTRARSVQHSSICPIRMCDTRPSANENDNNPDGPKVAKARKMQVSNSPPSKRKLVRNKPGMEPSDKDSYMVDAAGKGRSNVYADARPGDMVGGPEVGEGLGPRRGKKEKKVTRAAAIQKSQGFADAWAEQNAGKIDVWIIIGAVTLLTPILILVWAVATGVIPTGGLFE